MALVVALPSSSILLFDTSAKAAKERDIIAFCRSVGFKPEGVAVFWVPDTSLPPPSHAVAADAVVGAAAAAAPLALDAETVINAVLVHVAKSGVPVRTATSSRARVCVHSVVTPPAGGDAPPRATVVAVVVSGELKVGDALVVRPCGAMVKVGAVSASSGSLGERAMAVGTNQICVVDLVGVPGAPGASDDWSHIASGSVLASAADFDPPYARAAVAIEVQVAVTGTAGAARCPVAAVS